MNKGIDIKSLYINPQNVAKNPINSRRYLIARTGAAAGALALIYSLNRQRKIPTESKMAP